MVKLILQKNVNVNAVCNDNVTAIRHAAELDFSEAIDWMAKEHKANVNIKDDDNVTPLFMAAQLGKVNAVRALLSNGASTDCKVEASVPILSQIAEKNYRKHHFEKLLKLKGKGNIPDKMPNFSPLHAAICFGHYEIVRDLVKADPSLLKGTTFSTTPLELAHALGYKNIVGFLVQQSMLDNKHEIKIIPDERKRLIYKNFASELFKFLHKGVAINKSSLLLYANTTNMTFLAKSKLRKKQAKFLCSLLMNCYKKIENALQRDPVNYSAIEFEVNHLSQMLGTSITDKKSLRFQYETYSKSYFGNDELRIFINAISALQERLQKDLEIIKKDVKLEKPHIVIKRF